MTKTSKVVNIKSAGAPYESQYGTLYGFYISFENGDNGKYNSKTEDCVKFVIGSEATYEYIPREYQGKTTTRSKPLIHNLQQVLLQALQPQQEGL